MRDPDTMVLAIRRPWPHPSPMATQEAERTGRRWRIGCPFWTIAGRGFYWPGLITVWHHDPSGIDDTTCPIYPGHAWRFHIHHWRIQVHPLQRLRRRLLTRCEVCGGRSTRDNPINLGTAWHAPKTPWWRGEAAMAHMPCKGVEIARDPAA